ncbi:MAG: riboflavin synthase [Syntrophobacteraceae bacterium]|nr:riboflavin synthase [Syntrophobacteraceae bacterium]
MFTGLIEGIGLLVRTDRTGLDARMVIQAQFPIDPLVLGESIAVDGACLTVVAFKGSQFTVDVSAETLSRTTLGGKRPGARLNLERALRLGDRLGGHLVSGHVDAIGRLADRKDEGRSIRLFFDIPRELGRYTIEKGSVAVNGISLTINGCREGQFDVNVVPQTARETTIQDLRVGQEVNIETDLIGKYVEKVTAPWTGTGGEEGAQVSRIDAGFLRKHGFLP